MHTAEPLAPDEAARLTEFARAFKTAARSVGLYPDGHPAIAAGLRRMVQVTSPASLPAPMHINVLADTIRLGGRQPVRPDPALGELAVLLHAHRVGELVVQPGGDEQVWRRFLQLVGQAPDALRGAGGISRAWSAAGPTHIDVREVDYADVLRERSGGLPAVWDDIVAGCLDGRPIDAGREALRLYAEAGLDPERLAQIVAAIEDKGVESGRGIGARTAALLTLLGGISDAVSAEAPEQGLDMVAAMAAALGRLSPDMMLALIAERDKGGVPGAVGAALAEMPEETIAQFVARHVADDRQSIDRLAQAFHALVPDVEHQERLLALAHDEAAAMPFGMQDGFEDTWNEVAGRLLTSYSDEPYVSDAYAQELSSARGRAIALEQVDDDPPERVAAWLDTVATSELRRLDLALVLDLLRLEDEPERRDTLAGPLVSLFEDLLLVGDIDAAADLARQIVADARPDAPPGRRLMAERVLERLVSGPMLQHIAVHLAAMDEDQFARVKAMCVSFGGALIASLAEALAAEERTRPRERLTEMLLAFGPLGRREAERLKGSANPAVRRTAVRLLREFGGSEALGELAALLHDREPHVQREAIRAILNIGTDRALDVLEQAMTQGSSDARDAIVQSVGALRDERAVPLLARIVRRVDHKGSLAPLYRQAVDLLGGLKHPDGIAALREALYRGDWWSPRRTARLRRAAAAALARVGTPAAEAVLDEAARAGPRGVRAAVRTARSGGGPAA